MKRKIFVLLSIALCFVSCRTVDWVEPEFLSSLPKLSESVKNNTNSIQRLRQRIDSLERSGSVQSDVDDTISLLRKDIEDLKKTLQDSNSVISKESTTKEKVKKISLSLYDQAGEHLKNKEWKQAILIYEEFRKQNPKSDQFKTATLNIGLSFKNLDLKQEASIFFKEVIDRFPHSEEAQKAIEYLK